MGAGIADWNLMDWLQAAVHVMALVGGIAAGWISISKKLRRYASYTFPATGEAGRNILAPGVTQVSQGEHVALSAVVPHDRKLVVVVKSEPEVAPANDPSGMPPTGGGMGAWSYSIAPAPLNWRGNRYTPATPQVGAIQTFTAMEGPAELDLQFGKPGLITLDVHEQGNPTPTWSKQIRVL